LKPDVLKPDVLKPDVLWVYLKNCKIIDTFFSDPISNEYWKYGLAVDGE
jgi:hypothetical protein